MHCIALLPLFVLAVAANGYGAYPAPAPAPAPTPAAPRSSGYSGYSSAPASGSLASGSRTFSAQPVGEIVRLHHEIKQDQINAVSFDTSNGIKVVDETKVLAGTPNPENPSELWNKIAKSGSYSYTSPEGVPVKIDWTADGVNGFRATGSVIPTPPAVPAADLPAAPSGPSSPSSPSSTAYRY